MSTTQDPNMVVPSTVEIDRSQAPAGWYPDGSGCERYWDGSAWTETIRESGAMLVGREGAEPKAEGALSKLRQAAADKLAAKRSEKAEIERMDAEVARAAGRLVTSGIFGTSTVEIYEGGYVRIAAGRKELTVAASITRKTPYEKLLSIKYTQPAEDSPPNAPTVMDGAVGSVVSSLFKGGSTLMKTTVPGLAAAGVVQGVAHFAGAAGRRAYLTIATDRAIHSLTNESSNGVTTKTNKAHNEVGAVLETAGMSVLGLTDAVPQEAQAAPAIESASAPPLAAVGQPTAAPTVVERLREMAELHRDGILSDQEFADAKARLLAGL